MALDELIAIEVRFDFNRDVNRQSMVQRFPTDIKFQKWDFINEKNNDKYTDQLHHRILFLEGSIEKSVFEKFVSDESLKVCFVEYVVENRILRTKFYTRSMFLCGSLNN